MTTIDEDKYKVFETNAESWATDDRNGPVALTLRQKLLPVEGADAVIFPPTYAPSKTGEKAGYNIDELSNGTKVATIDSVGAQANRMEPLFIAAADGEPENPFADLVPQVTITYGKDNETDTDKKSVSILKVGHRLGDALIRSSDGLADEARKAFEKFDTDDDVSLIARLAPTSLVFGAWDSRGTQAKLPRIVQSVIRAWNVDRITRSAQYNPPVDYADLGVYTRENMKDKEQKSLSERGFGHVPAVGEHGGIRGPW